MTTTSHPGQDEGPRRAGRAQDPPITDPYRHDKKLHEPTVCPQCGAVYLAGRWQWAARPAAAEEELCPACHRIKDRMPAGVVTLMGGFLVQHRGEILDIVHRQEEIEKAEHPFNRIMTIEEAGGQIVVNTTDIHLPRRIAEALKSAFDGEAHFTYDEDGYFLRADWRRDI